jgi:lipase (class 3)
MRLRRTLFPLVACVALAACASVTVPVSGIQPRQAAIDTSWRTGGEFNMPEALALLEFCIALDYGLKGEYVPPVPMPANAAGWEEVFPDDHATLPTNRAPQGIGRYNNAWKLFHKLGSDIYVVAVRGTIEDKESIADDLIATSVADYPVRLPINDRQMVQFTLAETPQAESHLGWTYAMAALMFNEDDSPGHQHAGLLQILRDQVPAGSRILITGHSQGAAVATLVHAFLHYALADRNDRYGIAGKGFALKSYVFAQPKPGNWQFAMDFAQIANGQAFVINNDRDWVPQTPLSIQFLDEPGTYLLGQLTSQPGLAGLINLGLGIGELGFGAGRRAAIALHVENDTIKAAVRAMNILPRYLDPLQPPLAAYSVNYALAGTQVPVFGSASRDVPLDGTPMAEHHGPTYRYLLESPASLGGPPQRVIHPEAVPGM